MKIVEYNHDYAQLVADMWNVSGPNWGNDKIFKTKEDIIASESSSGNIKLYLALDQGKVVGYCSFSEYQHDEEASYLPLLNVIPEYHSKGVGKALILKVLEDAKHSNWPRFDLFTWSGNLKAMPLYKKCGFFWEKRNSSVHLMNFIPYLYQTEALKEYTKDIDFYKDQIRDIDMERDGEMVNGFDIYKYHFQNELVELKCEFEKTSRGLRYLETPDYIIEMTTNKHDVVFNETYDVEFKIVNKSLKPLTVDVKGKNHKNIVFDVDASLEVNQERVFTTTFFVSEEKKEIDKARTHPSICADLYINGKHVLFKTGLYTSYPLNVKLVVTQYNHVLNKEYKAYLDMENNLATPESFEVTLPDTFVRFKDKVNITLKPKEKRSVEVIYTLIDHGYYNEEVQIEYRDLKVTKGVNTIFKGSRSNFIAKLDDLYYMVSGNYNCIVNTKRNNLALLDEYYGDPVSACLVPQLGKPYNLEFSNAKPEVNIINDHHLTSTYTSKAFEGIKLIANVIHHYGVLEVYYEILNEKEDQTISLHIPVYHQTKDSYIPYKGKIMDFINYEDSSLDNIDSTHIDENWMYNHKKKTGLCWDPSLTMKISEWKLAFDLEDLLIQENNTYQSPSIYVSHSHKSLKDFRDFAGYTEERTFFTMQDVNLNNHNPFVTGDFEVQIDNHSKVPLEGVYSVNGIDTKVDQKAILKPGINEVILKQVEKETTFKRITWLVEGAVTKEIVGDSHIVDNGVLTFKASKDYADSIYSLIFDNQEWLDSNYPEPKERAWWGSFVGGLTQRFNGIQDINALKEDRDVTFVTLKDTLGNTWEGIKTTLSIKKEFDFKGLTVETYTLTLPGVPLVHSFCNVINNAGRTFNKLQVHKFNVLKPDEVSNRVTMKQKNKDYLCNNRGIEVLVDQYVEYTSTRDYKIGLYNPKNEIGADSQKLYNIVFSEYSMILSDNSSKQVTGDTILFTKETLDKEMLQDLKNITFEV